MTVSANDSSIVLGKEALDLAQEIGSTEEIGKAAELLYLAYKAKGYFINKEYDELGFLLDQAWNIKKQLSSNISNKSISTFSEGKPFTVLISSMR